MFVAVTISTDRVFFNWNVGSLIILLGTYLSKDGSILTFSRVPYEYSSHAIYTIVRCVIQDKFITNVAKKKKVVKIRILQKKKITTKKIIWNKPFIFLTSRQHSFRSPCTGCGFHDPVHVALHGHLYSDHIQCLHSAGTARYSVHFDILHRKLATKKIIITIRKTKNQKLSIFVSLKFFISKIMCNSYVPRGFFFFYILECQGPITQAPWSKCTKCVQMR